MIQSLQQRLAKIDALLAPYAVPNLSGLGRAIPEPADDTRLPFQRDRDRIIHTQAFRRLKGKTQVFVADHGDHYRTRITHTLEVAQISRDIARTLGLNEDLAESIALAHDLGHTPFGHAGEEAMRDCMKPFGKTFEHNGQSLRIVTVLEQRTSVYQGLNLSGEILEGLMKHRTPHDRPEAVPLPRSPSLEAQIVNLADEIAYTAHDTDDGIRSGLFSQKDVEKTSLGAQAASLSSARGTELRGAIVHVLVSDLYASVPALLASWKVSSLADVYAATDPLVAFTPAVRSGLDELRSFLWDKLYMSTQVRTQADRGKDIIRSLFAAFLKSPPDKVTSLRDKTGGGLEDAVKDYIAGMTDEFAEVAAKLIMDN